jgi:hypothetical protein
MSLIPLSDVLLMIEKINKPDEIKYLDEHTPDETALHLIEKYNLGKDVLVYGWGCEYPLLITKLYLDTYHNINPSGTHKFRVFSSEYDGYMSEADKMVKVARNSSYFELEEYEGKGEYYHEFTERFNIIYDEILNLYKSKGINKDEDDEEKYECILKLPNILRKAITDGHAHFGFLVRLVLLVLREIREKKYGDKPIFPENVYLYENLTCDEPYVDVEEIIDRHGIKNFFDQNPYNSDDEDYYTWNAPPSVNKPELLFAPFFSPRGAYGVNTFLYCYFNNLFLVGMSLNPYRVHFGGYEGIPFDVSTHDINHYKEGGFDAKCSKYVTYYGIYQYILANQDTMGQDRAKALMYILFMKIHEVYLTIEFLDTVEKMVYGNIPDNWVFFSRNSYYTPMKYGIPLDVSNVLIENFKPAIAFSAYSDLKVSIMINKYIKLALKDMMNDFDNVEEQIIRYFEISKAN